MKQTETKDIVFELKDMDKQKRTAIIAHAVYNNIDRVGDISMKGMFNKSWKEYKDVDFLFNHDTKEIVGTVLNLYEDDKGAYTEVKFGNWALGNDVLEMAAEGVLRGASFGYIVEKKDYDTIKGRKVRRLKEVKHFETSLVTGIPANPEAGIVQLNKSFSGDEIKDLTDRVINMEKFCRNTNASDGCIKSILNEIAEAKTILLKYNTDDTHDDEQSSSGNNRDESKAFSDSLYLLTLKTFN